MKVRRKVSLIAFAFAAVISLTAAEPAAPSAGFFRSRQSQDASRLWSPGTNDSLLSALTPGYVRFVIGSQRRRQPS